MHERMMRYTVASLFSSGSWVKVFAASSATSVLVFRCSFSSRLRRSFRSSGRSLPLRRSTTISMFVLVRRDVRPGRLTRVLTFTGGQSALTL